ncbi:MAG TPA: efflux RND transporter periplasmic adaptor subunit [Chthoniobacterales bacterium]|jgi:membrane fusion protein (multidrug efflux system)
MQTTISRTPTVPARAPFPAPAVRRRKGPIIAVIAGLLLIVILFIGIKVLQIVTMVRGAASMSPPATTVTSAFVKKANWQPTLYAVGSISAVQGAMLAAEVAGRVTEIDFESGAKVNKGDLLLKIDASSEIAQLHSAQADAALAKADLKRAQNLAKGNVIAQADFDSAQAKFAAAQASVENMQAIIDKKEIHAPFSGIAGIRYVNPGQQVAAGDKLVELQTLDQVYADFSLPQNALAKVKVGETVDITTDAIPGREFAGKLTAVNPAVDPTTRSVQMQASLDNKDHALRPGMFARVQVMLPEKNSTLYIPATAVAYAPYGDSVYVIEKKQNEKTKKDELILRQQFVRLGDRRGDFVAVTEGLKEGQEIVSTGAFKLRNGLDVVIDNKLSPTPELHPSPSDT